VNQTPHDMPPPADDAPTQDAEAKKTEDPGAFRRTMEAMVSARPWTITTLAIVLALVIGAVLIVLSDKQAMSAYGYFFADPGAALSASWNDIASAYSALFEGAVFNPHSAGSFSAALLPITETLNDATPLILGGLSVGLAFRAGLFNIGGQGQLIAGAICTCYVGFSLHTPGVVAVPLAVIAGIAGGAVAGGVVGYLKARTGAHEVIVTIMMNYVLLSLLYYTLTAGPFTNPSNSQYSKSVRPGALLPHLLGDSLPVTWGLILALAAAGLAWWLLNRSTLGFALRTVGANPKAARTAGINVGRTQVIAMLIAGALMGLVGAIQIMGTAIANHALTNSIDAGLGATAITVALLGRASPLGVVLASLLFGALEAGGSAMQASAANVPVDIVAVIQSLIVLFVAAPALIKGLFRLRGAAAESGMAAKGWNG
jgi:simple sugar transport system permease protein